MLSETTVEQVLKGLQTDEQYYIGGKAPESELTAEKLNTDEGIDHQRAAVRASFERVMGIARKGVPEEPWWLRKAWEFAEARLLILSEENNKRALDGKLVDHRAVELALDMARQRGVLIGVSTCWSVESRTDIKQITEWARRDLKIR
jgi:hypothetical protein